MTCLLFFFFLLIRRPPESTRTYTLVPYTTLFRSVAYGPSAGEKLDLFLPETKGAPIHMFIHGGYWSSRDKREYSVLAKPLVEAGAARSEEHKSELQSLMRISYAVFCLKKKNTEQTST